MLFLPHNLLELTFYFLAFYEHSQCTLFHILFSLVSLFSFSKHPVTCTCAHRHTGNISTHRFTHTNTYIYTFTQRFPHKIAYNLIFFNFKIPGFHKIYLGWSDFSLNTASYFSELKPSTLELDSSLLSPT